MFLRVAAFEFRYQLRAPLFWGVTAGFALFAGLMMGVPDLQSNMGGNIVRNAPMIVSLLQLTFAIFYLFAITAYVANAVVRDDETGFAPIIRSTRLSRLSYLLGRFVGSFSAAALGFLAVPVTMALVTLGPWLDPQTMGPWHPEYYLYGYAVIALPTLFIGAAALFVFATATRSMLGSYVGLIGLLAAYIASRSLPGLDYEKISALSDPFGIAAMGVVMKYWTASEINTRLPPVVGLFLWNRLIWLGVAAALLALGTALFRPGARALWFRRRPPVAPEAEQPTSLALPTVHQETSARATLAQFWLRVGFEVKQVATSPAFIIILLIGAAVSVGILWTADELYGTRTYPVTRLMVESLSGAYSITPGIIALFFGGEMVWRERQRKINEIVGATVAPDPVFVVSKTLALFAILFGVTVVGVVTAVIVQAAKGYTDFEFGKYLAWYVAPTTIDFALLAALTIFVQALSPNKFAGWGFMILYTVALGTFQTLVTPHNMLSFGAYPTAAFSDLNGIGDFRSIAAWYQGYWAACSIVLLAIACAVWPRGARVPLQRRLAALPHRMRGRLGAVAGLGLAAFIGLGGWILLNTVIWNPYQTPRQAEHYAVGLEKDLLGFEATPQPSVVDVKLNLDLHPREPRLDTHGVFILENRTGAPLGEVHLRFPRSLNVETVALAGATADQRFKKYNYFILKLAQPMAVGERRTLEFETVLWRHGFRDSGPMTNIIDNGTFLNNAEFSPAIGMTRDGLLGDKAKRRKHGLPEELRPAKLEDDSATDHNYIGADWVNADITITTDADQTPIAPGYMVSDKVEGSRRTARFVTEAPILHFFSVQSATYEVERMSHNGVELAIYHHPAHDVNVARMLNALKVGLDYYQANFGPYQFRQARVIEFPYGDFAQSFANTMAYSERIGFIADVRDPERVDYITFVTAHEFGHQWWAHQVVGADTQGAAVLSETLAEYSALMVMEKLYGPDQIRRFTRYELNTYLSARAGGDVEELPLYRAENQQHIFYQKGGMVMYLLRDQMGEEAVNRALRRLIADHAFKGAPYPRSRDLIAALRAEAGPEHQQLITDLFERITLYDTKVKTAKATRRADGRYDVTLTVSARKLYADGQGKESEAPLDETFDIGLFTALPGAGAFDAGDVIALERRALHSGEQTFTFITDRAPTYVGVDPYNKRIDRMAEDNIFNLSTKASERGGGITIKISS